MVAGDVSGDVHCARLVRLILERHPDCRITALGGPHLKAAGAELLADTSGFGVIGFAAALSLVPRALWLQRQVLAWLQTHTVDAVILCDWGAFNARLLPKLKTRTLFYFPPRSWQKHGAGGTGIARLADTIATPFEWSAQRLNAAGGNAHWVGHPVLELSAELGEREKLRREFGVSDDEIMIALLPGSRALEWKCIAPHINDAVTILKRDTNGQKLKFVAAIAPGAGKRARKYLQPQIRVVENRSAQVLAACDAAIVKSGTSTLEACALNAPQVVVYDVPYLLRLQWKWTLQKKVSFVAMPNILLGRELVTELLGDDCRAERIADEVCALLEPTRRAQMLDGYTQVHQALGADLPGTATARTLDVLEQLLKNVPPRAA